MKYKSFWDRKLIQMFLSKRVTSSSKYPPLKLPVKVRKSKDLSVIAFYFD